MSPAVERLYTAALLLSFAILCVAVGIAAGTIFGWQWCAWLPGTCTL
jgi:hypothetical protein